MPNEVPAVTNSRTWRLEMDYEIPVDYDDSWLDELDEQSEESAFWFVSERAGDPLRLAAV